MKQTIKIPTGATEVVVDTVDTVSVPPAGVSFTSVTPNQPPTANAGADTSITLPATSISLSGVGTDGDGTITAYLWEKLSGGAGTITNPTAASTSFTNFVAGTYVFRFTVTDDKGASASDTKTLVVNPEVTPPPIGYTLTFSSGYETTADLDPDDHGQLGNGSLSKTVFKDGTASFKSVPANVSSGIRSEVQYDSSRTPTEGAIEYDVLYETIFQNNGHSFQFHPNTSGGSASPGLWHVGGRFDMVNWYKTNNAHHESNITIQKNKWYHIRFEFKFGSAGYWRTFIDGVQIKEMSWTGQVGDNSGQYLKIGVNMWQNQSSTVYYDNLKIYKKN
jgi:hypothetical protein